MALSLDLLIQSSRELTSRQCSISKAVLTLKVPAGGRGLTRWKLETYRSISNFIQEWKREMGRTVHSRLGGHKTVL